MMDATVLETGSRVNSTLGSWARPGLALLMVMILVGSSGGVASLDAQDDPGIARLELKFERPRQITVFGGKGNDLRPDGVPGSGRTYWYLPYTIENKSGIDSTFHLGMNASSDKNRRYCVCQEE